MQRGIQNIFQNYSSICFLNSHPGRLLLFKFAVPQLAEYPSANLSLHISYHHILLILNAAGRATPFQGVNGLCEWALVSLRSELSKETHMLTKPETLLGRGPWAESRRRREPRSAALTGLAVSGFMEMGLISRLSLTKPFHSESFLVTHTLLSQSGLQQEGL